GSGPFFKVRLWDGQVAWISASAVDASLDAYPQLSGVCEEYDRLDWSKVVRPTPVPQVYNPPTYNSPAPSGGSSGGSSAGVRSCRRICTTGQACGDSCISRRY